MTKDDLTGLGLPDYDGKEAPDVAHLVTALSAVKELSAAAELIAESLTQIASTNVVIGFLTNETIKRTQQVSEERTLSLYKTFSEGPSDPDSDLDMPHNSEMFGHLLKQSTEVPWALTTLAPLVYQFGEECRKVNRAKDAMIWLSQSSEKANIVGDLADDMAIRLHRQRYVIDALSQLTALSEYITTTGRDGPHGEDQIEQAVTLANDLSERLASRDTRSSTDEEG